MSTTTKSKTFFTAFWLLSVALFMGVAVYWGIKPPRELGHSIPVYLLGLSLLMLAACLGIYFVRMSVQLSNAEVKALLRYQLWMLAALLFCMGVMVIIYPPDWLLNIMSFATDLLAFLIGVMILFGLGLLSTKRHRQAGVQLILIGIVTVWWLNALSNPNDVYQTHSQAIQNSVAPPIHNGSPKIDNAPMTQPSHPQP